MFTDVCDKKATETMRLPLCLAVSWNFSWGIAHDSEQRRMNNLSFLVLYPLSAFYVKILEFFFVFVSSVLVRGGQEIIFDDVLKW